MTTTWGWGCDTMTAPEDVPKLDAWIDTGGEGDQLHVRVEGADGTTYDELDADLEILLGQEQYVAQLSRPALTLLTLHDREVREERVETQTETADELLEDDVAADGGG